MAFNVQGFMQDVCSVCSGLWLYLTVEMKLLSLYFCICVIQHKTCFKTSCLHIHYSTTKAAQAEPLLVAV